jgi:hypothetical protein
MKATAGTTTSLVFSDLDQTLIYSSRTLRLGDNSPELRVCEVYQERPISFMTAAAAQLLSELSTRAIFVPVTTRTTEQYRRVTLPGTAPRFAVTTNGGSILVDGVQDADWNVAIRHGLADNCAPLDEVVAYLDHRKFQDWMVRLHNAENIFIYAIVNRAAIPANDLARLTQWCTKHGWILSIQGRKLYCVPALVTKEAAVAEVTRRVGGQHFIAAGDSLLDRGMLSAACKSFRPPHGELESEGFRLDSLEAVKGLGVLAGEEIVRRIHALVAGGVRSQGPLPSCDCGSLVGVGRTPANNAPLPARRNDSANR